MNSRPFNLNGVTIFMIGLAYMSTVESPTKTMLGKLLTPDDVVQLVPGITKGNLAQMRYAGNGPKFLKPTPRTVLYEEAEILAWLRASERTSTAEAG